MYAQLIAEGPDPQTITTIRVLLNGDDLADLHPLPERPDAAPLVLPLHIDRDLLLGLAPWMVPSPPLPPDAHYEVDWFPPEPTIDALRHAITALNPRATAFPLVVDLQLAGHSPADVRRQLGLPDAPMLLLHFPVSDEMIASLRAIEQEQQSTITGLTLEVEMSGALVANLRRSWGFPEAPATGDGNAIRHTQRVRLH